MFIRPMRRLGFKFPEDEFVDYEISDFKSKLENFNEENFEIVVYEIKGLIAEKKIGLKVKKNIAINSEEPIPKLLFANSVVELDRNFNFGTVYHENPANKFIDIIEVIQTKEKFLAIQDLLEKEKSISFVTKLRNKFFPKTEESKNRNLFEN